MEDQHLRRGFRLKSVSIAFQQLAEMPGSRSRTLKPNMFTLVRPFSSGFKLVLLTLTNWHVLIMIHERLTSEACGLIVFSECTSA
ncbi:hypothetical protein DA077_10880 [Lactiplantibacillus paraplantarum]|uniref:Uncharacterized protein n=1 Tax=Lactiplantibacillus paraplantarum TaxID=60520 RepID=A0AAD0TQI8_9LACO|nr:hypothetical protein DA077_10880 [Lactiplantibacillus paraplantarum]AYJ39423.1 hypothetical protein LP667_11700 [Lactiplantibacillus paraplantarum]